MISGGLNAQSNAGRFNRNSVAVKLKVISKNFCNLLNIIFHIQLVLSFTLP